MKTKPIFLAAILAAACFAPVPAMEPLAELYARTGLIILGEQEAVLANGLKAGWFVSRNSAWEISADGVLLYFPGTRSAFLDAGLEALYNYPLFMNPMYVQKAFMYFVPSLLGRFTFKEQVLPQLYLGLGLRFAIGENGSTFARIITGSPLQGGFSLGYGIEFGISIYIDRKAP
jgi:hypothetical protein